MREGPDIAKERERKCVGDAEGWFVSSYFRGALMMTTRRLDTMRALSHTAQVGIWDVAMMASTERTRRRSSEDVKLQLVILKRRFKSGLMLDLERVKVYFLINGSQTGVHEAEWFNLSHCGSRKGSCSVIGRSQVPNSKPENRRPQTQDHVI